MTANKDQYYQKSVVVVGGTSVGLATALLLARNRCHVTVLERNKEVVKGINDGRVDFHEPTLNLEFKSALKAGNLNIAVSSKKQLQAAALIIIAAEPAESGSSKLRLSSFERLAAWIGDSERQKPAVVMLRAAMPLGFANLFRRLLDKTPHGDRVGIVVSPVQVRPGYTYEDTSRPKRVIVGAETSQYGNLVTSIFRKIYPKSVRIIRTDCQTAELIRLASSLYIAQRKSLINEIAEYSRTKGLDLETLNDAIADDPRLGEGLSGPDMGFGGSQIPSDCRILNSREAGSRFTFETAKTALYVNDLLIDGLLYRLRKRIGRLTGYKIALLGITALPDTDDCRGSRAIALALNLRQRGAEVAIFDPVVKGQDMLDQGNLPLQSNVEVAVKGASAAVIGAPHRRLAALDPSKLAKLMKEPLIVDYFRFLKRRRWEKAGFTFIDEG